MEEELAEWLRGTFGIKIVRDQIAKDDDFKKNLKMLTAELQKTKGSHHQAASDSQTILRVYAMRERDSENDNSGVFGYRTWWLSTDTTTQKAVEACFGKRFRASCHMRTDFLHHYICLAPSVAEVNEVFEVMFPSLLGVNVSHHIPPEVSQTVRTAIRDHGAENPARVRGMIRGFSERLKSEATVLSKATAKSMVQKFFPNERNDRRRRQA